MEMRRCDCCARLPPLYFGVCTCVQGGKRACVSVRCVSYICQAGAARPLEFLTLSSVPSVFFHGVQILSVFGKNSVLLKKHCFPLTFGSSNWNGVLHSRGIQWRVAWCSFFFHRFVHRSAPDRGPAALKFTQRPPQPSTFQMEWLRWAEHTQQN